MFITVLFIIMKNPSAGEKYPSAGEKTLTL